MAMNSSNGTGIKAVIFDYGEVLCHRPSDEELNRLAAMFSTDRKSFRDLWDKNRGAYDRGDMSAEKYWAALAQDAGVVLNSEQLAKACESDVEMWATENLEMISWLKKLRQNGIKTAILSNIQPEMIARVRKSFDWLDLLDFKTFSAEIRMIKPEPAIYEHTLRGLGVKAAEALFIDDKEENVRAARALGIKALRFISMNQLRGELQAMGFPILPAA
jgi:putative hydrolase of the HAD superfamily